MNSLCLSGDACAATAAGPARAREQKLILRRQGLVADYVICGEMWCVPLEKLVPRSRAPIVEISPC